MVRASWANEPVGVGVLMAADVAVLERGADVCLLTFVPLVLPETAQLVL